MFWNKWNATCSGNPVHICFLASFSALYSILKLFFKRLECVIGLFSSIWVSTCFLNTLKPQIFNGKFHFFLKCVTSFTLWLAEVANKIQFFSENFIFFLFFFAWVIFREFFCYVYKILNKIDLFNLILPLVFTTAKIYLVSLMQ